MRFNLGFFLAEAFKNIRLNLLMSITAVTTTFICVLVFGMGLLVSSHVDGIVGSVRKEVTVEVFLPNAGEGEVDALLSKTQGWAEVTSVNKVTQEEALANFKETFEERPELYEDLEQGVLPLSLQLQLKDPEMADEVAARLKEEGFSEENLSYPQQTIERLNTVTSYMIWGLYGATILFLIASVLLISNAIRLSIFARRRGSRHRGHRQLPLGHALLEKDLGSTARPRGKRIIDNTGALQNPARLAIIGPGRKRRDAGRGWAGVVREGLFGGGGGGGRVFL